MHKKRERKNDQKQHPEASKALVKPLTEFRDPSQIIKLVINLFIRSQVMMIKGCRDRTRQCQGQCQFSL